MARILSARTFFWHPALLCAWLTACGGDQILGGRFDAGSSSAGGGGAASTGGAGGSFNAPDASRDAFCAGAVTIPTRQGDVCAGNVADRAFRFALCTCSELSWIGTLTTSGSVGVDGYAVAAQPYHVGGSLWIAGEPPGAPGLFMMGSAPSDVAKDLHVGGGIMGQGPLTVHGDVFSGGNTTCPGMMVDGVLHVPVGSSVSGVAAAKGIVHEPVVVPKPCDCKTPPLDIAAAIDALAKSNDDAATGIAPTDLDRFVGPKALDLPCGRYFFQQVNGQDISLHLRGRATIAVGGDVLVTGSFDIGLDPGAELDLYVGGSLQVPSATSFGSTAEPAKIRAYIGGPSVFLPAGMNVGANVYAPNALVSSRGDLELFGALFANRVSFGASVTVHYDEAILGGRGCMQAAAGACATCRDCSGAAPACKANACSPCEVDADCCPPLYCMGGACVPR
jgi:hypothetical protein